MLVNATNLLKVLKALSDNAWYFYTRGNRSNATDLEKRMGEKGFQEFAVTTSIMNLIEDEKHLNDMAEVFKIELE